MNIDELLAYTFYNNTVRDWLLFAGLLLLVIGGLLLLKRGLLYHLRRVAARTQIEADNFLCALVERTRLFFFLFVALYVAAQVLTLPPRANLLVGLIAIVAVLIQIGMWGNTGIAFWIRKWVRERGATEPEMIALVQAAGFLARMIVWVVVTLVVLDNMGVEVTALVAGLGIGGIAIALAVQNVLSDLLASLSIVIDKPFIVGDFIIVDSYIGTVEKIGLKTTRIKSLGGEQLILSNTDLMGARIRNYKRMVERRIVFTFGVQYDTPAEKVAAIPAMVREIIEREERARFDRSHFKQYGDSSLDFETVYHVLTADYDVYMDLQQAINLAIFRRFEAEGIQFAFPTRTLHVQGRIQSALIEGDGESGRAPRAPQRVAE